MIMKTAQALVGFGFAVIKVREGIHKQLSLANESIYFQVKGIHLGKQVLHRHAAHVVGLAEVRQQRAKGVVLADYAFTGTGWAFNQS